MSNKNNNYNIAIIFLVLALLVAGSLAIQRALLLNQGSLLTGAATSSDTGTSTLTIAQSTSITAVNKTIPFGSGFVNASCATCVMDSDGKHNQTGQCCRDFRNVSNGFLLENTGNINLSVNYTCTGSCNSSDFVGIGGANSSFEIKATANSAALQQGEIGAQDTVASCAGQFYTAWNFTVYKNISAGGDWLCGNSTSYPFEFTNAQDAVVIDINVSIPSNAPTRAQQTATFTFNGWATG